MHIVSAAENSYAPHVCALLHSAWLHHRDASYYLLATDIGKDNLALLRGFAEGRDIALHIIECDRDRMAGLAVNQRFSAAVWSRYFIPELLPAIDRVIYLDADITVSGSLEELFSLDMGGNPLAALPDRPQHVATERAHLGLGEASDYFNSGVMLLDLAQWRENGFGEQIVQFARNNVAPLGLLDQSALNITLEGRIQKLGPEFNFFDLEQEQLPLNPRIIHYSGESKPWDDRLSPFHDLYAFHRRQTPWPFDDAPFPIGEWIRNRRRRLGAWMGFARYRLAAAELDRLDMIRATIADPALRRARTLLARTAVSA